MSAPYKSEVDLFIDHFNQQVTVLHSVGGSPLHRKILYVTALDPLARAAYGPKLGNKQRITKLIRELSGWSDCERVSLPQLQQRLRASGHYRHKLYRGVSAQVNQWESGSKLGLSASPMASDLMSLARAGDDKFISECQYAELFYTYRNNLVHEFREPGYGWDLSGKSSEPYYMSYIDKPWELVFPVRFLETLVANTLVGLKSHLIRSKIDPYKNFQFGTMWSGK